MRPCPFPPRISFPCSPTKWAFNCKQMPEDFPLAPRTRAGHRSQEFSFPRSSSQPMHESSWRIKTQCSHPSVGITEASSILSPRIPHQDWVPVAHSRNLLSNTHFITGYLASLPNFPAGAFCDLPDKLFACTFLSQGQLLVEPNIILRVCALIAGCEVTLFITSLALWSSHSEIYPSLRGQEQHLPSWVPFNT